MTEIRERKMLDLKNKIETKRLKMNKEVDDYKKVIREINLQRQYLQQGRVH